METEPSHSTRVVILEDDFYARDALAARLQRDPTIRVVGELGSVEEGLQVLKAAAARTDLLLLDLDFPNPAEEPFGLIQSVSNSWPALRVLCLTLRPEPDLLLRAIGAGGDGIMHKNECADSLPLAIEHCLRGDFVVTLTFQKLMKPFETPAPLYVVPPIIFPPKTARHLKRIAYLRYIRGLTPEQISEELVLSRLTVDDYLKQVKLILQILERGNLATRGYMAITRLLWKDRQTKNP